MPRFAGVPVEQKKTKGPRFAGTPAEQDENQGLWDKAKSLVTGEGRTEYPNMPEFDLPFEFSGRQAKTAFGMLTTFDPKREMTVLHSNYPDIKFSQDKYGNLIADASAYGGNVGYVNKPGFSLRDAADLGFQIGAFTPAGKVGGAIAGAGKGLLARMAGAGATAAGTQAALDVAGQAAGATPEVSASNINPTDVAVAGLGGAAFEGLAGPIAKLARKVLPFFKRKPVITDSIRAQFKSIARKAGKDPSEVTDDFIRSWIQAADDAKNYKGAATPEALQQMEEFPRIRFSKGQASGDLKQLELEDTMRNVGGTRAQQIMKNFGDVQSRGIKEEAKSLQKGLGGDFIERPNQAAAAAKEAIQGKASALDEAIGQAYGEVGAAHLSGQGQKELASRIIKLTKSPEWINNPDLAGASYDAISDVKKLADIAKNSVKLKPAHIKRLEHFRQRLNNLREAAKNPMDARQVGSIKREFDRYLDDAIDNALFSGDQEALDSLKAARGLRVKYRQQFGQNPKINKGRSFKDTAGDVMEKIVGADPTDEQVANYLFGSAKLGAKNGSAQLAKRMKEVLGPKSPEWGSIRQAAFLKLTQPPKGSDVVSGREFLSRLNEATKGSGESFMKEVFTPKEIGKMRRLGEAIKRAQPEIKNPSKTSYKAAAMINQLAEQLGRMLGWTMGPGGGLGAEVGIKGTQALGGMRAAAKASRATNIHPFARLSSVPSVGAPASVSTYQDMSRK